VISEQASGLTLDNDLLVTDVVTGKPLDNTEVLSLAATIQSIFVSVTLESRSLDQVDACHRLWVEVAQLFSELCDAWAGIESDDASIAWLRRRLTHFMELALDRCELYSITESARRVYAKRKALDSDSEYSFGTRGEIEPVREF
jgi:hypothetical protein